MKQSYITVTDQFCGAGGSSQGVRKVSERIKGVEVKLALNHWELAIKTHNTNFPNTLHDCTDISACDPRRYPSTDILITSPECTNHSLAKGKKIVKAQMDMFAEGVLDPAAERSRATMWDVPRFAEYHSYNIIIVENVVDARKWVMFDAWLMAMHALGYNHKCVYLNSMFCYPTPQSRDRMYIVFWKIGNKTPNLEYMPAAHCPKCAKDVNAVQSWKNPNQKYGKYGKHGQYLYRCPVDGGEVSPYYYAAFNCIDWSDRGIKIGDRKKELSKNTIARIECGLKKYESEYLIVTTKYHSEKHENGARSISEPLRTQPSEASHGLLTPFLIDDKQTTGIDFRVRSVKDSVNTIHTDPRVKLVMPFIIKGEHSQNLTTTRRADEPLQTHTTRQTMGLIVPPFLTENNSSGKPKRITDKFSTFTAGGINQSIVTTESWNSFLAYNYNGTQTSHITEPTDTIATKDKLSLISYKKPQLEDCYYRMLKPGEVKLAMAFDHDYVILGSGKDQVKQCGNAVTPPAMEWLVERCIESLN